MGAGAKGAIQSVGLVLRKVDDSTPPSYTPEFVSSGGRTLLARDVEAVVRVMADPANNDPTTWCTGINDILNFATLTNRYFDIGQTSNPALDDFKKDWLKVKQQANCP